VESVREMSVDPVVKLAIDLVDRPSVTPTDGGCQRLIAERLRDAGFICEPMVFGDVTNLWARLGSSGPVLCFAGHTDVVPPGDFAKWETDPFVATIRERKLFGRGAADMKGSLAAMIVAAERFSRKHPRFTGSLAFLVTSDEEGLAVNGTKKVMEALTARGSHIDWCVVGEPSSGSRLGDCVRIGRRGSLTGSLRVHGIQGHVAYPHLAKNPIRLFAPFLAELHSIEWDKGNEHFPPTSFEVVRLECGVGADNVIPFELLARFNFRYSTEWNSETLASKFVEILHRHQFEYQLEWIPSGEPFLTSEGHLTDAVSRAISEKTGIKPGFSTGGGTSDGRFIAPTGADVVELGPRNETIHKVNENTDVQELIQLSAIFERIMEILLKP
jgi:succinyl-diaminopimelate desuccinylase